MKLGSFFLAEIKRMISSLSPRGTVSASISVTNPYLYSWLTNSSVVFVAVFMVLPFPFSVDSARSFADHPPAT